jgi:hypothetical protein
MTMLMNSAPFGAIVSQKIKEENLRTINHHSVNFYFTDESEPSLVSSLTPTKAGRFGIYLLYAAPVSSVRHNPVSGALTQPHCHYSNEARKAGD